jgi:hypothetical protein
VGGFAGFGQSGGEQSSTSGLNNIFNYSLPTAQQGQSAGSANLGTAANYYQNLLTAGRTQTAQNAAPALNAQLQGTDTRNREQSISGTGRTGGTAESNAQQSTANQSNIDNIINSTLQTGKATGASGLTQVGSTQLNDALAQLGIATGTQGTLYSGSLNKEGMQTSAISNLLSSLL